MPERARDDGQRALLVRGASPHGPGLVQYEVPLAVQVPGPEGLLLEFQALEDLGASCVEERFRRGVLVLEEGQNH